MKFPASRPPLTIVEIRTVEALLAARGPLSVGELREALGLELEDMGDVLDALTAFGLIARLRDPESER